MSEDFDSVALLADLCLAVQRPDEPARRDMARVWFLAGVRRVLREGLRLDEALGLAGGPGVRPLPDRVKLVKRDALIARAAEAVALDLAVSDWERCKRVAKEVAHLARTRAGEGEGGEPPLEWPACRRLLLEAQRLGLPLPVTAGGVRGAVLRNRAYSQNSAALMMLADFL